MLKKLCQTALCFAAFSIFSANAKLITVDVELQLLTDVSGSLNSGEYTLQRQGYINAFRNSEIIDSILKGKNGSIAVQYIEWSGRKNQSTQIDWFLINSIATANTFADMIAGTNRAFKGRTGIADAINYGASLFSTNAYEAARQIIDVSGDGKENEKGNVSAARDAALAGEVDTINGITIGRAKGLSDHYINNVIGGKNAFHLHADTFESFNQGIVQKLKREISISTPIPEPSSIALVGLAIIGLFGAKRKRA